MLLKLFDFFNSCRSCWTELTPFWACALLSWEWGCRSCSRRWWRAGKVSECTWSRGRRSWGQLRSATCSSTRYAIHPVHSTWTCIKDLKIWLFFHTFILLCSPGTGLLPLVLAGAEWDEGRGIHPRCCHLRFAVVSAPAAMGWDCGTWGDICSGWIHGPGPARAWHI